MTKVLINGIDSLLGAQVAALVSAEPGVAVIGLGRERPPAPIGRADWLAARLSREQLVALLRAEGVDVVVHLAFAGADGPLESREAAVQQNVLGSMELLGACASAGVGRVVLRSHTGVYGASPLNPTFITEDRPPSRGGLSGLLRDFAEVEHFAATFAAQRPALAVVRLRCAPLLGAWSPLADYFTQPGPRMLLGFDPCLQLLHLDDAAAAFAQAALGAGAGPYNLAADDTLCLSQAIRLAGQQPVTLLEPAVALALAIGNRAIIGSWPFDLAFLRYSCIADTRRARQELGWTPAHGAADALRALRANGRAPAVGPSDAALQAFLSRRSSP
jgi:UDP-glucose 4-epimerase